MCWTGVAVALLFGVCIGVIACSLIVSARDD
jgi:hypothetical protein